MTRQWKLSLLVGTVWNSTYLTGKPKKSILNAKESKQKFLSIIGIFLKNRFVEGNAKQKVSIDGKAMGNNFTDEQSSGTDCFQKNE